MSTVSWRTISSQMIFEDPWIRLRVDRIEQLGFQARPYSVIELKGGVGIVALNEQSQIVLVGQYRYPVSRYSWEIPKGAFNDFSVTKRQPLATAKRELKEETGYRAKQWDSLTLVNTLLGSTNDEVYLFCARNLTTGKSQLEKGEDITVRLVSVGEFWAMVSRREITDATSIAAVGICSQRGFL